MTINEINFKLETTNVNSKLLFNEIHSYIKQILTNEYMLMNFRAEPYREDIVGFIYDFLDYTKEEKMTIEQFKVMCDKRNNTINDLEKGDIVLDVHYKQKHCLNTTKLRYTIFVSQLEEYDDILGAYLTY